jgi:hypothetical protein
MRADKEAVATDEPAYANADLICDCQDRDGIWDLKVDVQMQSQTRALATATFALSDAKRKEDLRMVRFEMIAQDGAWRIHDVCEDFGDPSAWCLRKAMLDEIRTYKAHPEWKTKSPK